MIASENKTIIGHILSMFTVLIWGLTFVSSKVVLTVLTPVELLFLRFMTGFLALFLMHPRILKWQGWKMELMFFGTGFFGVTLYFLMENIALTYTYASYVSLVVSVVPFLTAIACAVAFKDKTCRTPVFFLGFIVSMTGIGLVCLNGVKLELNPIGLLLAFLAASSWAVYSAMEQIIDRKHYHIIEVTRRMFCYALLSMLPLMAVMGFKPDFQALFQKEVLLNFLFLGVIASAVCYFTWNSALRYLGTIKASVYLYLPPIITVAASFMFLGEKLSFLSTAGILLTIAGTVVSNIGAKHSKSKSK